MGKEGVPAVALWRVTSRLCVPRAAFPVLRKRVQMNATKKEGWMMERPGLEWRKVDGGVC